MTLEEAMDDRKRKYAVWHDLPPGHPDLDKAHQAWWDAYSLQEFMMKSPTHQLCIVAKQLKEKSDV